MATRDRGLVLNPYPEPKIDRYNDADFSGIYGNEKATDSSCLKGITIYVITVEYLPMLWKPKFANRNSSFNYGGRNYLNGPQLKLFFP